MKHEIMFTPIGKFRRDRHDLSRRNFCYKIGTFPCKIPQYFLKYGEGEADVVYALLPEKMEPKDDCLISESTVKAPPSR